MIRGMRRLNMLDKKGTTMVYVRLDTKLLNNIEAIAHASHKSVAKVINELLEKSLKEVNNNVGI